MAAWKAEKLGYKNVRNYGGGFPAWIKRPGNYAAIGLGEVKKALAGKKQPVLLIDSRPKKAKFDKGHIPGAISLPQSHFEAYKGLLPSDKSIPLIFYCEGFT